MPILEIIIFFTSGLSIMMALGLIVRQLQFRNVVLAIILALMGYLTLYLYFLQSEKIYEYPVFFFSQVPVIMTLSPLLYFYVLSITGDKTFISKIDMLHFIPMILISIYMIQYYLYDPGQQRQIVYEMMHQNKHIVLRSITAGMAFLPALYLGAPVVRIIHQMSRNNPVHKKVILLFSLLILWLIINIIGIGATIALSYPVLKVISVLVSVVILMFYLISQRYPYLLQYGTVQAKKESYSKSYLTSINLDDLDRQLNIIMDQEKFFCDEDLSLSRLSHALGITSHQLSQFLNKHYNKNFNSYVNGYRINEAKKLLIEEPSRNTLSVAEAAGFNSYSAFHAAFRKDAGISPAEYRRKKLKNGSS